MTEKHIHIHIHLDGLLSDESEVVRHVTMPTQRTRPTPRSSGKPASKVVRAWAVEQGIQVPKTGRIPKDVVDAYQAVH